MGSPESGPIDSVTTGTDKLLIDFPAEAVARLTISIPDKRNALDHDVLDAISSTLPRLDRGIDIRCLIVTGADPVLGRLRHQFDRRRKLRKGCRGPGRPPVHGRA